LRRGEEAEVVHPHPPEHVAEPAEVHVVGSITTSTSSPKRSSLQRPVVRAQAARAAPFAGTVTAVTRGAFDPLELRCSDAQKKLALDHRRRF
jgi:hypothetical protein